MIHINIDIFMDTGVSNVEFVIDNTTGIISFDMTGGINLKFIKKDDDLGLIILANAMKEYIVEYNPPNQIGLKGRTVEGIATEIWQHNFLINLNEFAIQAG